MTPLVSTLLAGEGFRHAFFTRAGGVSEGAFASLNFAWSNGDDEARVRENLARGAAFLGVSPSNLYFLSQVHGAQVEAVTSADAWDEVVKVEGDAVVSRDPRVACAVRMADCVPVLVADAASGAVCAIHSGWRGTVLDVVGAGVAALSATAKGAPRLIAAIGPHISLAAFEVGLEVADAIERGTGIAGAVDRVSFAKPHVSLRAIIEAQLVRAGVGAVEVLPGCTVGDPARFFSFRRDGKASGRHLAAIVPREHSL